MKVAYFDCPSGAAGDMIMASLVDAGVPLEALRAELGKLPLEGWTISAREVRKGAFRATKVDVEIDQQAHRHHRSLGDILDILERSSLEVSVKARAARIFTRLAEAEARVHGTDRESVHFHDVGAVDAIIDVTGGIIALDLAGVEAVHISALPIGGGLVGGPHGRIPVPGPGTAELLRGFPVVDTGVKAELVTPTGAAILTTLAASAGRMPSLTVEAVGYGAGTMDLPDTPNILRCFLGATTTAAAGDETVLQVETTIDGQSYSHEVEPRLLLVHYIRENVGLTGTHVGCDTSQCGACTILMDGQAVKACNFFAVQVGGANIMTIEGLAKDGELHPIQQGFWEKHGLQCGFCTPGMIMSAYQMLERYPKPSEAQIRHQLEGNLCRCTGYHNIVKAIEWAAEHMPAKK